MPDGSCEESGYHGPVKWQNKEVTFSDDSRERTYTQRWVTPGEQPTRADKVLSPADSAIQEPEVKGKNVTGTGCALLLAILTGMCALGLSIF